MAARARTSFYKSKTEKNTVEIVQKYWYIIWGYE